MFCERCGLYFREKTPRQKYCSKKCLKGNRSSKKYNARYAEQAADYFTLRKILKSVKRFKEEINEVKEKK